MRRCSGQRSLRSTLKHTFWFSEWNSNENRCICLPSQPHPVVKLGSEGFPPDGESTLVQSMEVMSVQSEGHTYNSSQFSVQSHPPSLCICCLSLSPSLPPIRPPLLPHSHFPSSPVATAKGAASTAQSKFSHWDTVARGFEEEKRETDSFFFSAKANFRG